VVAYDHEWWYFARLHSHFCGGIIGPDERSYKDTDAFTVSIPDDSTDSGTDSGTDSNN
jgi:hypothetical protein